MVQHSPQRLATVTFYVLLFMFLFIGSFFLFHYPDWYAGDHVPVDAHYNGHSSWLDPWDINVYSAAIKWGHMGNFFLANRYTTEGGASALMYPFYTLLGMLFSANVYSLFHAFAIIMGGFLILSIITGTYLLARSKSLTALASTLIVFGGGLGWLGILGELPDMYMTSFTFYSAFQRGHEAWGVMFYIASLVGAYLIATSRLRWWAALWFFSLIALSIYPFQVPFVVAMICGLAFFLKKNRIVLFTGAILLGALTGLYYFHLMGTSFNVVATQKLPMQNPLAVIAGYGLLLIPYAIYAFKGERTPQWYFLNAWFLGSIVLSFIPMGTSRFFLRGNFFPLAIAASYGLVIVSQKLHARLSVIAVVVAIIAAFTSFQIFWIRMSVPYSTREAQFWVYEPRELSDAIAWLGERPQGVVMGLYPTANAIPARTHHSVYIGHTIQTRDFKGKQEEVIRFYDGEMSVNEMRRYLRDNSIRYIIWGPYEQTLNGSFPYPLPRIYSQEVSIYEFRDTMQK